MCPLRIRSIYCLLITLLTIAPAFAQQAKAKRRRTTMVPVTTMEELPVLSAKERAELRTALEQAEQRIKAGQGIDYDPKSFKQRLVNIYRGVKR